ncbi:Hypothetical protein DPCES_3442 [Desulfitobacterium hafniense]|uniref:Uncharacterized protein n=1 Tax=Desulfitobacterium hafniense TaxID=49338 RepID=A0A098B386_DESHA|nr:hypothetical protein [Desulfitobacterium hafniense]CDX03328.1 Hypothetical protein DPCES_3442 [Desulfitobacterium hafniense]
MKVKACPYCETPIESDEIPESCPSCGKELNPKQLMNLDIRDTPNYIKDTNTIADILKALGLVTIVLGFIVGLIMAIDSNSYANNFSLILALPFWIGGFISGIFMLGFSEIINLLHKINLKVK